MRHKHLVTPLHLERLALICVPATAPGNGIAERTADLRLLARKLGWPADRIVTITSLMGESDGQSPRRAVLERLLDEVSEWRVGTVLGLDQSGIAKSSHDYFQILDSCRATGTLLADGDRIEDPAAHRQLVVLGPRQLSDFDAWIVRGRLLGFGHESEERFDVSFPLPAGYVRDRLAIHKDPNPGVREGIAKTIEALRRFGRADAAALALEQQGVQLPYRRHPESTVRWGAATPDRVDELIGSPCMAGAYLYGRRRLQRPFEGRVRPRKVLATGMHENRSLLVMNHHEPYLEWNDWIELQAKLDSDPDLAGDLPAHWEGSRLLLRLAVCGHCGKALATTGGSAWMYVCTSGRHPGADGRCVPVPGRLVDSEVVRRFLFAVLPGGFEASRVAVDRFPAMADELVRTRWLTLDRLEYGAAKAYRRHREISGEFGLVARKLKREWDVAETALTKARNRFARTRVERPDLAIPKLLERFSSLGARLEVVWNAGATTDEDRRGLLRILLEEVELRPEPELGWVRVLMRWKGGATGEGWLPLR